MSRRCFPFELVAIMVMLDYSVILMILNVHTSLNVYTSREIRPSENEVNKVKWCKPLRWREPPGPVVALASYPGSGNTWLRYLLQHATGIYTGSVFFELEEYMPLTPFDEPVANGSVLVVKTHRTPFAFEQFQMAILLIRHPRDAILSHYNFIFEGHTGTVGEEVFRASNRIQLCKTLSCNESTVKETDVWSNFVNVQIKMWELFNVAWLSCFQGPIHAVFYEELVRDINGTLRGIFNFLNVDVTEEDLNCTLQNREGFYRRRHRHKDFDPFTPKMYEKIYETRRKVLEEVSRHQESKKKRNYLVEWTMIQMTQKKEKSAVRSRHVVVPSRLYIANSRQFAQENTVLNNDRSLRE